MAPTFKHGKGTVVLWNSANLSTVLNETSIDATVDTADITTFGEDDKVYIPGLRDATASFSGFVDGSTSYTDRVVDTALGGSTQPVVTWGPLGAVTGDPAILAKGEAVGYSPTSPISDAVNVNMALQISGGPEGRQSGYWLSDPSSASTDTGSGTTVVDNNASTTAGGSTWGAVAHLHVVSETTSTGALAVQHSTDGAAWSDLVTFTFSSGASVQRSTVSGAVKEQFRVNITALSTAGATIGLAVARNRAST